MYQINHSHFSIRQQAVKANSRNHKFQSRNKTLSFKKPFTLALQLNGKIVRI
jgi:hypothetical protein